MPLSIVVLASLVGQFAILTRKPLIVLTPDSPTYLVLGHRLATHLSPISLFDAARTPGYPAFLAFLEALRGHEVGNTVAFAQGGLLVVTAIELYVLTHELTGSRMAAVLAGVLIGTNLFLLDWERTVMTEVLAIFAVATTMLCLWQWMRRRRISWALAFALAAILTVLTRPSFLYLPLCLVALIVIGDHRRWLSTLVVAASIYVPLAGYAMINDRLSPHAGLTTVSNINQLGKILEYQMQGEGDAARFPDLWQAANSLPKDDPNPYLIWLSTPDALGTNQWTAAEFSQDIIRRHPVEYAAKSLRDFAGGWLVVPYTFARVSYTFGAVLNEPAWSQAWMRLSLAAYDAYLLGPLAIVGLIILWRRLDRQVALVIGGLGLAVVLELATIALLGYGDVARLRTPVDPLAMVFVISVASLGVARLRH